MALGARLPEKTADVGAMERAPWWGSYIAAMDHAATIDMSRCFAHPTKKSEHSAAMFRHHPSADGKDTAVSIYNSAFVQLHRPATQGSTNRPQLDWNPPLDSLFVALAPLPPANSMSNIGAAVPGDFTVSYVQITMALVSSPLV